MKGSAIFVNIGRGDLVKEEVLIEVLQNREIAHAILIEQGHPFWRMENVMVTPHLSSKSSEYLPRTFSIFEKTCMNSWIDGKDFINVNDLLKGY